MNRSLTNTGAPDKLAIVPAYAVISRHKQRAILPKNQSATPLRMIKGKKYIEEIPEKKLKPQQLIAGMAFHLFGLGTLPMNEANKQVIYLANYTGTHAIEVDFAGTLKTIKQAAQPVHEFSPGNEIGEKGEIYKNNVSEYTADLTAGAEYNDVISYSKVMCEKEVAVIYNTSETDANEKFILMQHNSTVNKMNTVYGYETGGSVHVFHSSPGGKDISYIKIYLKPMQLIVLKNY